MPVHCGRRTPIEPGAVPSPHARGDAEHDSGRLHCARKRFDVIEAAVLDAPGFNRN